MAAIYPVDWWLVQVCKSTCLVDDSCVYIFFRSKTIMRILGLVGGLKYMLWFSSLWLRGDDIQVCLENWVATHGIPAFTGSLWTRRLLPTRWSMIIKQEPSEQPTNHGGYGAPTKSLNFPLWGQTSALYTLWKRIYIYCWICCPFSPSQSEPRRIWAPTCLGKSLVKKCEWKEAKDSMRVFLKETLETHGVPTKINHHHLVKMA